LAIAHRGSRLLWPENTMVAFSGAAELGYRHLDTDVRLTSDGVLVCFHDSSVDRTTEGHGPVGEFTFDELRRLDAGYMHRKDKAFPFRGKGVSVPSLEEVVTALPDTELVVDLKEDATAPVLAALTERLGIHDRLTVGSFSDRRLARFRSITGGRVKTSSGPWATVSAWLASRLGRSIEGEFEALQIPVTWYGLPLVDARMVSAAHDRGLEVHVWTVNRRADMIRLLDLGVDGITTDRPDLLKEVLTRRGEWDS
jgi:glycerophosphoryl diester phosphodiesterase